MKKDSARASWAWSFPPRSPAARIAENDVARPDSGAHWKIGSPTPKQTEGRPRSQAISFAWRPKTRRPWRRRRRHPPRDHALLLFAAPDDRQTRIRGSRSAPLESHAFRRARRARRFSAAPRARAARRSRKAGLSRSTKKSICHSRPFWLAWKRPAFASTPPNSIKSRRRRTEEIAGIEKSIFDLAGFEFNISSPQQLAEVLFDKLHLQPPRRSRAKSRSTAAEVLEELAQVHELPKKVIEFRELPS